MRIGLYHGYELTGSGSNEYNRYLSENLAKAGHKVHIICREPSPEKFSFIDKAYEWESSAAAKLLFQRNDNAGDCVLHKLPDAAVTPVYLTDKQRPGNVKSFVSLTDEELAEYHQLNEKILRVILTENKLDILHANHLVYQPSAALNVCRETNTPLIIFPHGSSIEYVIRADERYKNLALKAILICAGLIIGNREVRDRIINLYPEHKETILAKTKIAGVGVDTSLFKPVQKSGRNGNIGELIKTDGRGGKGPELVDELYVRLKKQDIQAVKEYWTAYNHSLPDEDLNGKLKQIPWEQNILLFVGALTAGKGMQGLITAMPFILSRQPDTHLVIVGAGTYREALEGLVYALKASNKDLLLKLCSQGMDLDRSELSGPWEDVQNFINNPDNLDKILNWGGSVEGHIHFLGRLNHARLKYLFPCADLAVFPSIVPEAYPLVLMESFSNGVIPIVSYFSGFKDGVDELESVIDQSIIERMKISNDPNQRIESIIENICALLAGPDLSAETEKLRRLAVEEYDWKNRAGQIVRAYEYFIEDHSSKI